MRVLVTGTEGQLGRCLQRTSAGVTDSYIFTGVAELDITDREAMCGYVADNDIDIIINCAAYTDVERAESEESKAHLLNATAVGYLAEALVRIISERNFREGTYHYTNLGECSWWQFAKEITRLAWHNNCNVMPCTAEEYPSKARRPMNAVLDKSKFVRTFDIEIPEWRESLKKCIDGLQA